MAGQNGQFVCVLDIRAQSGETPLWSVAEQKLYWVDQLAFRLNVFDPATGHNQSWQLPAHISSFALRGPGRPVLVALRTGLFDFDRDAGTLTPVATPPPYPIETHRYNDGRCDRQGRYTPDGRLDFEIPVPVMQPTKVAFGGPDLTTLYLTSASYRHLPGDQPLGPQAGGLFAMETGFRGSEEPLCRF